MTRRTSSSSSCDDGLPSPLTKAFAAEPVLPPARIHNRGALYRIKKAPPVPGFCRTFDQRSQPAVVFGAFDNEKSRTGRHDDGWVVLAMQLAVLIPGPRAIGEFQGWAFVPMKNVVLDPDAGWSLDLAEAEVAVVPVPNALEDRTFRDDDRRPVGTVELAVVPPLLLPLAIDAGWSVFAIGPASEPPLLGAVRPDYRGASLAVKIVALVPLARSVGEFNCWLVSDALQETLPKGPLISSRVLDRWTVLAVKLSVESPLPRPVGRDDRRTVFPVRMTVPEPLLLTVGIDDRGPVGAVELTFTVDPGLTDSRCRAVYSTPNECRTTISALNMAVTHPELGWTMNPA
jgi:hypothetical protein